GGGPARRTGDKVAGRIKPAEKESAHAAKHRCARQALSKTAKRQNGKTVYTSAHKSQRRDARVHAERVGLR
ncbi:hypothetical protein ACVBEH_26540, partial [Roseateles sp. GG27B]